MLVVLSALWLTVPAMAQAIEVNNAEIPGSVLVFPKFIRGTVQVGTTAPPAPGVPEPIVEPKSAFEISVTCPTNNGAPCAEGTVIKLLARWICPGSQDPSSAFVCKETDFELFTTVKGTIWFNPESVGSRTPTSLVPRPPCQRGWLIVWVVSADDADQARAIKFDGLVGNGVLRNGPQSIGAYNAVPIQAVDGVAPHARTDINDDGRLQFDGTTEYKAITGQLRGTIRFERSANPPGTTLGRIHTLLTVLTLDTRANRPNYPTFIDLHFFNENEVLLSGSFEFICWAEARLTGIDINLDEFFGRMGLVETTEAEKVPIFGITDTPGPVTLLGLVDTLELSTGSAVLRQTNSLLFNDGRPVPTTFDPN